MDEQSLGDRRQSLDDRKQFPGLFYCAIGFYTVAIGLLAALGAVIVNSLFRETDLKPEAIRNVLAIVVLAAGAGFALTRVVRFNSRSETVLPPEAREILRPAIEKSPDPIGEWIRLAGLIGGTGVFRKLELSGMPLATILMTVLFCALSLATPAMNWMGVTGHFDEVGKGFMDMAKLTLGAFIGSFVTKGTSRDAEASRIGAAAAAKAASAQVPRAPVAVQAVSPPASAPSPDPG
jgi:hypothetical protein